MKVEKLSVKKKAELRLIADSTYDAIQATATRVPKVTEKP